MATNINARQLKCSILRSVTGYIGTLFGKVVGEVEGEIILNCYTKSQLEDNLTLPSYENMNKIVICTDGDNGSRCLVISDGLYWLKINIGEKIN
jgi:hypothetical protein